MMLEIRSEDYLTDLAAARRIARELARQELRNAITDEIRVRIGLIPIECGPLEQGEVIGLVSALNVCVIAV